MAARPDIHPTNMERPWSIDEIIVSKTDLKGRITYANDVFVRVAQWKEDELLGQPHSIIRHPSMPRCVFKLLWDTVEAGREIFAYVKNLAKSGDYYWVFAHVTPSFDGKGNIIGYHSNRRKPDAAQVKKVQKLYEELLAVEASYPSPKEGMQAAYDLLMKTVQDAGMGYDEFVFTI